jgi:cell fate (sporulation/competence/biofilm development) regulator YlbF (YheA/YmcA/DUF963 family)
MLSIIAKAIELGQEIANSPELKNWREAEQAVQADPTASSMIREFELKQQAFQRARSEGRKITTEEQEALIDLHQRMNADPKIKEFLETKRQFQQILNDINQILYQAIHGSACTPSG